MMRPQIDPLTAWIALLAICFGIIALACLCQAVSLEISGHSSGAGLHTLYLAGDRLNATISQGNNSTWLINATGAA